MSHFTVMVIGENIEKQLQPFHEFECTGTNDEFVVDVDITEEIAQAVADGKSLNDALGEYGLDDKRVTDEKDVRKDSTHKYGYAIVRRGKLIKAVNRTNPNKQWDWYELGGRWSGFLKLKPGAQGDNGDQSHKAGWCDSALKRDIDFEGMRAAAQEREAKRFDAYLSVLAGREEPDWEVIRAKYSEADIGKARKEYHDHPVIIDLRKEKFWSTEHLRGKTLEQVIAAARNEAVSTFAVLKDGQWYERGSMGWWGIIVDEEDAATWHQKVSELLDSIPNDERISIVDCHI